MQVGFMMQKALGELFILKKYKTFTYHL